LQESDNLVASEVADLHMVEKRPCDRLTRHEKRESDGPTATFFPTVFCKAIVFYWINRSGMSVCLVGICNKALSLGYSNEILVTAYPVLKVVIQQQFSRSLKEFGRFGRG